MPAAQVIIPTDRAAGYLTRLCGHAAKMSTATSRFHRPRAHAGGAPPRFQHVQQDGDEATVILDCGQWTMHAAPRPARLTPDTAQAARSPQAPTLRATSAGWQACRRDGPERP